MSEPVDSGNGRVSYTVKELLAALDKKIDKLIDALEHKADLAQLTQVRKDVMNLEGRVKIVEKKQEDSSLLLAKIDKVLERQDAAAAALAQNAKTVQRKSDSAFNRRDKLWMAAVSTLLLVVSVATLGPHFFH